MNIEKLYKLYTESYLIDTDTRKIRQNSIFFALKGDNFNGNTYAKEAINKGAKYAIIDQKEYNNHENIFLVDDVLITLQKLAKYHRKKLNIPIISLTGSNGKTTTKELINAVLSKKYNTTATLGNLNNHIGVPLTLLSMDNDTEIGIIEMGANHHNEIAFLSEITCPNYGYITNFGKAHLEGFGSLEGVIQAKSELYDYLIKNNKKIFINQNDPVQLQKTKNSNRILFHDSIVFKGVNPFVSLYFKDILINTKLIGAYNYNNIAIAINIGNYFNVNTKDIVEAIEGYAPNNNRSQIINTTTNKIILDAYNANPSSMLVAIENLNLIKSDKKTIILGDMFELGGSSLKEHQNIINFVSSLNIDNVLLVGENFHKTRTSYPKFKTTDEIKKYLAINQINSQTILIKGSRGMALEDLLEYIK